MTVVEGDPKAPFLIATTPRCSKGTTSFPGLLHFTLDLYLIMLSVKQGGIEYPFFFLFFFWVFGMTWPGIEPRSPGPLANTLTIMPMSGILVNDYILGWDWWKRNIFWGTCVFIVFEITINLSTKIHLYVVVMKENNNNADV